MYLLAYVAYLSTEIDIIDIIVCANDYLTKYWPVFFFFFFWNKMSEISISVDKLQCANIIASRYVTRLVLPLKLTNEKIDMYYRVNIPRNHSFARQYTILLVNKGSFEIQKKSTNIKKKRKKRGQKNRISTNYDKRFWKITIRL